MLEAEDGDRDRVTESDGVTESDSDGERALLAGLPSTATIPAQEPGWGCPDPLSCSGVPRDRRLVTMALSRRAPVSGADGSRARGPVLSELQSGERRPYLRGLEQRERRARGREGPQQVTSGARRGTGGRRKCPLGWQAARPHLGLRGRDFCPRGLIPNRIFTGPYACPGPEKGASGRPGRTTQLTTAGRLGTARPTSSQDTRALRGGPQIRLRFLVKAPNRPRSTFTENSLRKVRLFPLKARINPRRALQFAGGAQIGSQKNLSLTHKGITLSQY